jgi:hypothetical protein
LIYKAFSLRNFSSICCKHGVAPLCVAWNSGCPQSYPQILWVSKWRDGAHSNVTVCDEVGPASWAIIADCFHLRGERFAVHHTSRRLADLAPDCVFRPGNGADF